MNRFDTLKYLGAIRDLEAMKYTHQQAIDQLRKEYNEKLNFHRYTPEEYKKYPSETVFPGKLSEAISGVFAQDKNTVAVWICGILAALFGGGMRGSEDWSSYDDGAFWRGIFSFIMIAGILMIIIASGIIIFKVADFYQWGNTEYNSVTKENKYIDNRNEKEKEKIDKYNKTISYLIKSRVSIPKKIKILEAYIVEIDFQLSRYYCIEDIPNDYRNLIAICSFFQYFDTRRCSEFEGPHGAYNLYTDEMYKKMIIMKLDVIISKLDQIQNTQRELYRVLNECSQKISDLKNAMNSVSDNIVNSIAELSSTAGNISDKLSSIEQSNSIMAYNSKFIAEIKRYEVMRDSFC